MLKNGAEHVHGDLKDNVFRIKSLTDFDYINEENGKDEGVNVRQKALSLVDLINNPSRVKFEREKAKSARDKFVGISASDRIGSSGSGGGYGGGGGSGGYSSGGGYDRDSRFDSAPHSGAGRAGPTVYSTSSAPAAGRSDAYADEDDHSAEGPIPVSQPPARAAAPSRPQAPATGTMIDFSSPAKSQQQQDFFNPRAGGGFASDPFAAQDDPFAPRQQQQQQGVFDPFGNSGGDADGFGDFAAAPAPQQPTFQASFQPDFGGFQSAPVQHQQQFHSSDDPFASASFQSAGSYGQQQQQPAVDLEKQKKAAEWAQLSSLVNLGDITAEKKKDDGKKAEPVFADGVGKVTPSAGTTMAATAQITPQGISGNYAALSRPVAPQPMMGMGMPMGMGMGMPMGGVAPGYGQMGGVGMMGMPQQQQQQQQQPMGYGGMMMQPPVQQQQQQIPYGQQQMQANAFNLFAATPIQKAGGGGGGGGSLI
jgi:epsin